MKTQYNLSLLMFVAFVMGVSVEKAVGQGGTWQSLNYSLSNQEITIDYAPPWLTGTVTIPSEIDGFPVTTIGENAFLSCKNITEFVLPEHLHTIGAGAFRECESVLQFNIPENVKAIGNRAFERCKSLVSINWPSKVSVVPDSCFKFCTALDALELPLGVTKIDRYAFERSGIAQISLPNTLEQILDYAFRGCNKLTSIEIPPSVTTMHAPFTECEFLTKVVISERYHSESSAKQIGLTVAWPNGFLTHEDPVSGVPDTLQVRMVPMVTVEGTPGDVKRIEYSNFPDGPWTLWKVVIVGSGGTSEVDTAPASDQRFYRIR